VPEDTSVRPAVGTCLVAAVRVALHTAAAEHTCPAGVRSPVGAVGSRSNLAQSLARRLALVAGTDRGSLRRRQGVG
jgi:hypothetical protein